MAAATAPSLTLRAAVCYFFRVSLRTIGQWLAIVLVLTLVFGELQRVRRKHARQRAAAATQSLTTPPAR